MRKLLFLYFLSLLHQHALTQDSTVLIEGNLIQLSEVIVRSDINVPAFIRRVKTDTGFYKSFRNLRILKFNAINDVRMLNKKGGVQASLNSRTRQYAQKGCRFTEVLEEKHSGDFYDASGDYNYYTASMYAGIMFARDTVCNETNIVKGNIFDLKGKRGLDKHKEQLKMLFFLPGVPVPGIPFIGNKLGVFEKNMQQLYDFRIDLVEYQGENCYLFEVKARSGLSASERSRIVIDEMKTWLAVSDMNILGKTYRMRYNAGVYDFDVNMEVELKRFAGLQVPTLIRYTGDWDVPFKTRERGVFTAVLYDFKY